MRSEFGPASPSSSLFWVANVLVLQAAGIPLGLAGRLAETGMHLVFFLHLTTGPENASNVLALAFGVVILIVAGSL